MSAVGTVSAGMEPVAGMVVLLEFFHMFGVAQREPDVIQAVEQAVAAEGVDNEAGVKAVVVGNFICLERDGEGIARMHGGALEEKFDLLLWERDQKDAILGGIRVEDVGEARRDYATEAIIGECPGGMFAGGSATEVFVRDEDLSTLVAREVELEVWIWRLRARLFIAPVAPVEEQKLAVAGALNALEKLLGNDLVGVHINPVERGDEGAQSAKGFHT